MGCLPRYEYFTVGYVEPCLPHVPSKALTYAAETSTHTPINITQSIRALHYGAGWVGELPHLRWSPCPHIKIFNAPPPPRMQDFFLTNFHNEHIKMKSITPNNPPSHLPPRLKHSADFYTKPYISAT